MTDSCPEIVLNRAVEGRDRSITFEAELMCARREAEGKTAYRLGLGQSPFPVPELLRKTLCDNVHRSRYITGGLPELRDAVVGHSRRTLGLDYKSDHVIIGPGSKQLIFNLQLALEAQIVLPTPTWVTYPPQARFLNRSIHYLETKPENGWCLTASELESFCASPNRDRDKTCLLILSYPSNPAGTSLGGKELRKLAEVARQHQVLVLADEIYSRLHHTAEHESLASYYPEGTIVSGGLSKWFGAAGWRLGAFLIPNNLDTLAKAMSAVESETYSCASAPIQYAAVPAYQGGAEIDDFLRQSCRILREVGNWVCKRLRDGGVDVAEPRGGFYLFPDFSPFKGALRARKIESSMDLFEKLFEETGVALLPGSEFKRRESELTARLAYVDFDGQAALAKADEIPLSEDLGEDFLRKCCGKVLEATEVLCDWLPKSR